MSENVTIGKNGTRYPRKFDWDEARRLRFNEGLSISAIAARLGVSPTSIDRITNEVTRARLHRNSEANIQRKRRPCKGGCGKLVWLHMKDRSGYCPSCYWVAHCRTARPDTLLCTRCKKWLPDDAFHFSARKKTRRGRVTHCRSCSTRDRADYRNRQKIPCVRCGRPCLPYREKGRRPSRVDTGLCITCYRETI